jgi:streptogramin lyase
LAELLSGTKILREFPLSSPKSRPHALAIDASGNVWVTESGANRIDRVSPRGSRAVRTTWVLPHANSGPDGVALSADGTVWVTERADRLAHLTPRSGRIDEYALSRNAHPHAVQMARSGPVLVNEDANTVVSVRLGRAGAAQLTQTELPTQGGAPAHLVVGQGGVLVTENGGNAVAWLDGKATPARTVRPSVHVLSRRVSTVVAVQTGLPEQRYEVTPRAFRLAVRRGAHWAEWKLPHARSEPYDLRALDGQQQAWVTEDARSCVGLLQPGERRVLEYRLPQTDSAPKGLEVYRDRTRTHVWIASYGVDRLALLTTPLFQSNAGSHILSRVTEGALAFVP